MENGLYMLNNDNLLFYTANSGKIHSKVSGPGGSKIFGFGVQHSELEPDRRWRKLAKYGTGREKKNLT